MSLEEFLQKNNLANMSEGMSQAMELLTDENGQKIVVENRKVNPETPERLESPRRAHRFQSAESLISYLERYGGEDSVVFANPDSPQVTAIVNEKAGKGYEAIHYMPMTHPKYAPWEMILESDGVRMPIKKFSEFLRINKRVVRDPEPTGLLIMLQQIKISSNLELHQGNGRNAVNGLMATVKINGQNENKELVEIPETIKISLPVYVQTDPVEIEVDIALENISDIGDKPEIMVVITSADIREKKLAAFEGAVENIKTHVEQMNAVFTYGTVNHLAWEYTKDLTK